jgi:uridine phosphorylase
MGLSLSSPGVVHLRPTAPIAADALLPGDPGRALALAQELLEAPKMSNHHRGLWGYYGETAAGRPLTIQATGIGGPSAAVVLSELARQGVRRAVRIGTGVAASAEVPLGTLLVPPRAQAGDGTSGELGFEEIVPGSDRLSAALARALPAARPGVVATVDVYYYEGERVSAGVDAFDMATAPLYAVGQRLGVEVGCVLAVVEAEGERMNPDRFADAELEMGRAAAAALAAA